jgi:hypothetical protein
VEVLIVGSFNEFIERGGVENLDRGAPGIQSAGLLLVRCARCEIGEHEIISGEVEGISKNRSLRLGSAGETLSLAIGKLPLQEDFFGCEAREGGLGLRSAALRHGNSSLIGHASGL